MQLAVHIIKYIMAFFLAIYLPARICKYTRVMDNLLSKYFEKKVFTMVLILDGNQEIGAELPIYKYHGLYRR